MRQIRIQRSKLSRAKRDLPEVLPLDPRDPDIVRAKRTRDRLIRESSEKRAA